MNNVSDIKRKKGESFEAFMRRVKQSWQRSGKLLQAKKVQFYIPKKSKNVKRKITVAKVQTLARENYLRKIGKLPPEENQR